MRRSRQTVYVGETENEVRRKLWDEMSRMGFRVMPEAPMAYGDPHVIRAHLSEARLAVHFLSGQAQQRAIDAIGWSRRHRQARRCTLQHNGTVFSAAFSPDGSQVVTASSDGTARVWNVLLACCYSQQDSARLASLAEAVGGYEVNDTGTLTFIGIDEQRERLKRLSRGIGTGPSPDLSIESIIRRFTSAK